MEAHFNAMHKYLEFISLWILKGKIKIMMNRNKDFFIVCDLSLTRSKMSLKKKNFTTPFVCLHVIIPTMQCLTSLRALSAA